MTNKSQRAFIHTHKSQSQQGAALLAVLIITLILVILMSVASQTMQSRLDLAENSKQHVHSQAAVKAKISELSYLLVTQRVTVAGISQGTTKLKVTDNEMASFDISPRGDELRVDGFIYQQENGLEFSLQNQAGLIPVNSPGQYWLKQWLKGYGYSVSEQARFADTLADYADPDTWRRPGGAELASYKEQSDTVPANFLLQSCSELWRVLQWPNLLQQHENMLEQCSLSRGSTLQLNAVPLALWATLWPNSAQKVAQQRQRGKWILTNEDVLTVESSLLLVPEEYISPIGGRIYTLSASKNNSSKVLSVEIGTQLLKPFIIRATTLNHL